MKKTTNKKADCKPVAKPLHRAILANEPNPERPDPTKRRPNALSRTVLPLVLLALFQASSFKCEATITVTGLVSQITSAALDTKITFTPGEDILLLTNGLSAGPAKTISSTNGAFSTPLNPGTYLVRLPLVSGRNAFTIGVPHGSGDENITNLIAAPWTYEQFLNTVNGTAVAPSTSTAVQTNGGEFKVVLDASQTNTWRVDATNAAIRMASDTNTALLLRLDATNTALRSAITDSTNNTAFTRDAELPGYLFTNNPPSYPLGQMFSYWEVTKKLLTTNISADGGGLRCSTLIFDRDGFTRVYYAGYSNTFGANSAGRIVMAVGIGFDVMEKHGVVLDRGGAGQWDRGNIGSARIYRFDDSGTNYLYYFASTNTTFETGWQACGVAYTTNGTNFTKYSGNPIIDVGTSGQWDDEGIQGAQCVVKHAGVYYMYFSAKDGSGVEQVGLATATNPLGPWTKYAGNPVLASTALRVEPNVFRLQDGQGWGMIMGDGAYCAYAISPNLTNWTERGTIYFDDPGLGAGYGYFGAGVGLAAPGSLLSPFLFDDNGPAFLADDTRSIFIVRPKQSQSASQFTGWFTGGFFSPSNSLDNWPTAPRFRGESYIGNSNGWGTYILSSGGGLTWTRTNKLGGD